MRAVGREQEGAVGGLGLADLDRQRADQQPDLQFLGQRAKTGSAGSCASSKVAASLAPPSGAIRVVFSGVAMKVRALGGRLAHQR